MKKISRRTSVVLLCAFVFAVASIIVGCNLTGLRFEIISLPGFDPVDNAQDWNDYPWSMTYFVPDGSETGHLYVGTGNGIDELLIGEIGVLPPGENGQRPPEIRRYRPDLGPKNWERVFDFRDLQAGPFFTSTGLRHMTVYRGKNDHVNRIYASSFGFLPMVFRSATGDSNSWELFWTSSSKGSIRWMTEHNGLLYIAVANDVVSDPTPGQIWVTDGDTISPVMQDGFGNPDNRAIMSLASYNGWLYAGTANKVTGYEVWKLEGPDKAVGPVKVLDHGGIDGRNQAASPLYVYRDKLYVGSMILFGAKFKGFDMLRLDGDDNVEVVVGENSLSGFRSGFNNPFNAYAWWFQEHDGYLYLGTWDSLSLVQWLIDNFGFVSDQLILALQDGKDLPQADLKNARGNFGNVTSAGGDLWQSRDGVHWEPVFTNGLGNTYNYGVRTMISVDKDLYLGIANPFDGLSIWKTTTP